MHGWSEQPGWDRIVRLHRDPGQPWGFYPCVDVALVWPVGAGEITSNPLISSAPHSSTLLPAGSCLLSFSLLILIINNNELGALGMEFPPHTHTRTINRAEGRDRPMHLIQASRRPLLARAGFLRPTPHSRGPDCCLTPHCSHKRNPSARPTQGGCWILPAGNRPWHRES